ncbi:S8 family peptidase [Rhodococcus sp. AD45]|uniref:S8 family peptidase n=1 Tax=Rhodococcus sp. (strain AD45) TaxID=103808 RepID=UPI001EF9F3D3|nr:S8 family peptidase [Rhodococcus sp. AD45]
MILGARTTPRSIPPRRGGGGRARFTDPDERAQRIDARFEEAVAALGDQIQLSESIQAADPQLVLVLEALDEQIDLTAVADKIGLEILFEAEGAVEPNAEYELISKAAKNPYITSCLHAICMNQTAFNKFLSLWRQWKNNQQLPFGYSKLRDLFAHLKDVRPWGPQDRLKMIDWDEHFEGQITDLPHAVEIELWYRQNPQARAQSQQDVTKLIEQSGGEVHTVAVVDQIGYHGLKCTVPTAVVRELASGNYDAVRVVSSADVMYLKITGQALPPGGQLTDTSEHLDDPLPSGDPVACLLDGVPAPNHPLLKGRVTLHDPDDLLSTVEDLDELKHGTWMASAAVWGDLNAKEPALHRPILVRPILAPSAETVNRNEELPATELVPDLMRRIFRELFDGENGQAPAGKQIAIINISVGDPASPFDSILSSWARMIDWLSYEYGVLVVISAGNHSGLTLTPVDSRHITGLNGEERRQAVLDAQHRQQHNRRLLAPAESINALTVGAVHADASEGRPMGYAFDPTDGLLSISPISPTGSGYRRSVKPDLAANGGRVLFRDAPIASSDLVFTGASPLGPGIRVATPKESKETHISGTSPAAALVTRQAVRLHDVVDQITTGQIITRRQRACAIKALLVHGTELPAELSYLPLDPETAFGNGILARNYADGCATNEAVLLFLGSIGAAQELEFFVPLPDGLGVVGAKRIEATLTWLSPVNWRHRQYRKANLSFVKPSGAIPGLKTPSGLPSGTTTRGATTVQRQCFELDSAFGSGRGSDMAIRIKCYEQAGGLAGEKIDFAVAVSLWVAPVLGVDVYSQVRAQVQTRVPIQQQ